MVANNLIGVCEALIYANKAGLNEESIGRFWTNKLNKIY